jgi:hypothetical protein
VRPGAAALIQKHHAPVNVIGGFKFANAPVIDLGTVPTASSEPTPLRVLLAVRLPSNPDPGRSIENIRSKLKTHITENTTSRG